MEHRCLNDGTILIVVKIGKGGASLFCRTCDLAELEREWGILAA